MPGTSTQTDTGVATNPFALTDPASGNAGITTVIDAQTGQEVLYDPQNGGFSLVPSIFDMNLFNFDPVCLNVSGATSCIGYIDPQNMSPLPHLIKGTDKLASALTQNDPRDPILPGLADAYADLYFLREVARGERKLTDQQEFYLREHAAGIAYIRREAVADAFSTKAPSTDFVWEVLGFSDPDTSVQDTAVAGAVSTDATSIVGVYGRWQHHAPVAFAQDGGIGTLDLTSVLGEMYIDASGSVVDPFALSQQRAQNWADSHADREVANYVLKHADRATILRLQLANARIRIRTILERAARDSYLDHSEDIAALEKIDDPAKLAVALQDLNPRIVRGQKLKQLQNAAIAVGNSVVYGDRTIDLAAQIHKLSKLPLSKQKEFYKGVKKFVADHKIVALAYNLDQLKEIVDAAETAAGKVEHAPPKLSAAQRVATAGSGGGRTGVTMASMGSEGTKERNELESYFGGFGDRISAARAKITKGDLAGARKAFNEIKNDKTFGEMQTRLKEALGFEEGYRMGQKIGIIAVSAAFAAIGGGYVGAWMLTRGVPAWVASLGSLATEAAIFLGSERVGSKVLMGEQIFDSRKGIRGNAIHYAGEWVKVMLMFAFLRAGMKTYKGVVDAVVGSRAAKSVVEGVLAKAEKVLKGMRLNPELAGKLARSAKLRAFGKILNHGGAFVAEYTTFTAWDYLMQLHETKSLPKGFFTSKSMVDRLIFLGCLKMGGAAARPFVQPLQAKVMAGQMRRYAGRIEKYNVELQSLKSELVEYDAAGKVDFAKNTGIHGRMKKLLTKRAGLEAAILKINPGLATDNPEFAEGVKRTAREIKDAEAREKEAAALAIVQSGSYMKRQRKGLMSFLREGVSRKALSYDSKRDGTIDVTFKGQKPISVKLGKRAVVGTPHETAKVVAKTAAVGGAVALGIILDPTFGILGFGLLGMVTQGRGAGKPVITPGAEGANGSFGKGSKGTIKLSDGREATYEVGEMDTASRSLKVKLTVQGSLDGAVKAEISRALYGKTKTVVSLEVSEKPAEAPPASAAGKVAGPKKIPATKPAPESDEIPTRPVPQQSGRVETQTRLPAVEIPRPSADEMFMKWWEHSIFVNHHAEGTLRRTIIEDLSRIDVVKHPELKELRDSAVEFLSTLGDCGRNLQFYDRHHKTQDPAMAEQRYNILYRDITSQMGQLERSLAYKKAVALHDSWRTTFEPAKERVDQIKRIGLDMGEGVTVRRLFRIRGQLGEHYDTDFANIKPNEVFDMVVEVKSPAEAQSFMARMAERGLMFTEDVPHISRESGGRVVSRELKVLLQSGEGARFRGETITVKIRVDAKAASRDIMSPKPVSELIYDRPEAEGGPVKLTLKSELDWPFHTFKYVDSDGRVISTLQVQGNHMLHANTIEGFRHLKLNTRLSALATRGYDKITAVITNDALMPLLVKDWRATKGLPEADRLEIVTGTLRAYQPFVRGRTLLGYTIHEVVSVEKMETRDSNGQLKTDWMIVVRSSRDEMASPIVESELPAFFQD